MAIAVEQSLHDRYAQLLSGVQRYDSAELGFVLERGENLLEHVEGMLGIAKELMEIPALASQFSMDALERIIWSHDGGEILAGDIIATDPRRKDFVFERQRRLREREAFAFIAQHFPEPDQTQMLTYYARYEAADPDDTNALLVHWIDKVQAGRFIAQHAILSPLTHERKTESHAALIQAETDRILGSLTSPQAISAMWRLGQQEISYFLDNIRVG